jgi:hypothetical protein
MQNEITIKITSRYIGNQIAEARDLIDAWLSGFPKQSRRSRKSREIEMIRFHWPRITYRTYLRELDKHEGIEDV